MSHYQEQLKDPMLWEMMHSIHDSAVRLIEIVNDFLDVSALEQGKIELRPEDFRLGPVVDEVLRDLASVAGAKSNTLVADESLEALPAITADRQRIKQVIYNLVGNAIKFTDRGEIVVGGSREGEMVRCYVKDSGQGMSEESHRLLFRKFQQAGTNLLNRDSTKGTGLGLYISKLIVELSGGSIGLEESRPGDGSTFSLSLPVAGQAGTK
jgi:signal transduction histidine kinase